MDVMSIDGKIVDEIVRRVTSVEDVQRIILFGSAATGGMSRDSDIDLLILKPEIGNWREEWFRVRMALRGLGYPFDIIFMTRERFEETKDVVGGIAYPASRKGTVIYEAA